MSKSSPFKSSVLGMQGNLLSFALKLTLNKEEAQDLVQDTTLKALRNEDKFVENSNFKGWMLTIMRNIFINNYRKSTRENTMVESADECERICMAQFSDNETPEGAYSMGEISDIIAAMPADYRGVALAVNRGTLLVENVVIVEQMFSDFKVALFHFVLGALDSTVQHWMVDRLARLHSDSCHYVFHALAAEKPHQVVVH